jgi:N-acetylmuramoyl-L-alanine amidase
MGLNPEQVRYTRSQAYEVALLALVIWREAQNQGYDGMLGVGWSIRNRVLKPGKTWWGDDWEEVILKRWQYTSMEKSDPNATKMPGDPGKDIAFANALQAAELAYCGIGADPTDGATHYYNPKAVAAPAWVTHPATVYKGAIGDHLFYIAN